MTLSGVQHRTQVQRPCDLPKRTAPPSGILLLRRQDMLYVRCQDMLYVTVRAGRFSPFNGSNTRENLWVKHEKLLDKQQLQSNASSNGQIPPDSYEITDSE